MLSAKQLLRKLPNAHACFYLIFNRKVSAMLGAAIVISRLHVGVNIKCENYVFSRMFKNRFCQDLKYFKHHYSTQGTKNSCNWRTNTSNQSWSFRTNAFACTQPYRQTFLVRSSFLNIFKSMSTNPILVNTNIKNNVMLFRYETPWTFRIASIFALGMLIGCLCMADIVYNILCKKLFDSSIDLKTRLLDHAFPLAAIIIGVIAGPLTLLLVWYVTVRTVKYAILHKGGQTVTFITYHPWKSESKLTVPTKDVSCVMSRTDAKTVVTIKIKDQKYHYMLDKKGHFVNEELYEASIGVRRF